VVNRVGLTYSRLLLGLIVINFCWSLSCLGRRARRDHGAYLYRRDQPFRCRQRVQYRSRHFLLVTYTCAIFDKMIIAGTGAITARNIIERIGAVDVTYSFWLLAFFPCAIVTILIGWRLTLWLFPPEIESLENRRSEVQAHFSRCRSLVADGDQGHRVILLALALWLTDWLHGISAAKVAFGVGLLGLLPFIEVLNAEDFRKANMLPYFFVAAALGMSEVLRETGGLKVLTDTFLGGMEPLLRPLDRRAGALLDGVRLSFLHGERDIDARDVIADPDGIRQDAWARCALGRYGVDICGRRELFAYQSAPLIVGYAYGYFRHVDMLKLGAMLTVVEFLR